MSDFLMGAAGIMGSGQGGYGENNSWSLGASQGKSNAFDSSWNQSSGYSVGQDYSKSNSIGEQWADSITQVFGSEASAMDKYFADAADQSQWDFWKAQAAYNSKEAEKARAHSEFMSNTAYQRAIQDLKAAGLNPILAAGNMGASTPGAVAASSGMGTSHKANATANSYSKSNSYGYNKSSSHSAGSSYSTNSSSGGSYGESNSKNASKNSSGSYGYTSNNVRDLATTAMAYGSTVYNKAVNAISNAFNIKNTAKAVAKYNKPFTGSNSKY